MAAIDSVLTEKFDQTLYDSYESLGDKELIDVMSEKILEIYVAVRKALLVKDALTDRMIFEDISKYRSGLYSSFVTNIDDYLITRLSFSDLQKCYNEFRLLGLEEKQKIIDASLSCSFPELIDDIVVKTNEFAETLVKYGVYGKNYPKHVISLGAKLLNFAFNINDAISRYEF